VAESNQPDSVESTGPGGGYVQLLQIHPADNVAVATLPLEGGKQIAVGDVTVLVPKNLPLGAKVAIKPIPTGGKIYKYGEPIGSATEDIALGDYVHTHNLHSDYIATR